MRTITAKNGIMKIFFAQKGIKFNALWKEKN